MEFPPAAGSHANRYVNGSGWEYAARAIEAAWFGQLWPTRRWAISGTTSSIRGVASTPRIVRNNRSKACPTLAADSSACQARRRSPSFAFSASTMSRSNSSVSSASKRGSLTCTLARAGSWYLLDEVLVGVLGECQRTQVQCVDRRNREQGEVWCLFREERQIVLDDVVTDQTGCSVGIGHRAWPAPHASRSGCRTTCRPLSDRRELRQLRRRSPSLRGQSTAGRPCHAPSSAPQPFGHLPIACLTSALSVTCRERPGPIAAHACDIVGVLRQQAGAPPRADRRSASRFRHYSDI